MHVFSQTDLTAAGEESLLLPPLLLPLLLALPTWIGRGTGETKPTVKQLCWAQKAKTPLPQQYLTLPPAAAAGWRPRLEPPGWLARPV